MSSQKLYVSLLGRSHGHVLGTLKPPLHSSMRPTVVNVALLGGGGGLVRIVKRAKSGSFHYDMNKQGKVHRYGHTKFETHHDGNVHTQVVKGTDLKSGGVLTRRFEPCWARFCDSLRSQSCGRFWARARDAT